MTIPELQKKLEEFSKEELINHILNIEENKLKAGEYFQSLPISKSKQVLEEGKTEIKEQFAQNTDSFNINHTIRTLNNQTQNIEKQEHKAELLLFFITCYTNRLISLKSDESKYHMKAANMLGNALTILYKLKQLEKYEQKIIELVTQSEEASYELNDNLWTVYYKYY